MTINDPSILLPLGSSGGIKGGTTNQQTRQTDYPSCLRQVAAPGRVVEGHWSLLAIQSLDLQRVLT